jgi:RNA polymerase sigma factor (sigma-70 family)
MPVSKPDEMTKTMTKTDAQLVAEARRGQRDARDELVRRYQRQIALIAGAMVNDPAEGQDLGQEAFVRAFRNLDLLADPSRFGPWLRRIVVGVSIDWLRSFRPDLYRGWDGSEEHTLADVTPSPLDHVLRDEMSARVAAALASLPPRYRVPIRLFHLDGLSHSKIADTLGVPVGTVRSLVARARRKLAPLLADYAPEALSHVDELFEEQQTMASAVKRFMHVANGSSTTGTIHAAGIPGASSVWADVLYEGPVPGDMADERLLELRARYLADDDETDAAYESTLAELRRWRAAIDNVDAYDELILWFEHDLFDQLNLIQLLSHIGRMRLTPTLKPVSLICIGSFPGRERFKGLGELTPDELASLLDTRQPVNDAQYALAARAWQAFRAPDPQQIEMLIDELSRQEAGNAGGAGGAGGSGGGDDAALPFLAAALQRHLEEFPSTVDGLSRTERRLMELAHAGPIEIWTAFPRMHDLETAYYVTDRSFGQIVRNLSAASGPLLAADITSRAAHHLPRGTITLTDAGRAVLAGTADRVTQYGLDRWLGGVHLKGSGKTWRWDDAQRRMVYA